MLSLSVGLLALWAWGRLQVLVNSRHPLPPAGAPEVLNFLRNHVLKLNSELSGQPGVPVPSGTSFGGSVDRMSASPRSRSASPVRSHMTSTALLESLSALNQQLQRTDRPTFRADAELQVRGCGDEACES